jgi:two-component system chemotaxis response regulator CheY
MDLTMPVLDGFKATAEIMKLDKNAVVIIATADIQPKSVERVTALGAFTVIKKPVKPQLMQEVLAAVELKLSKLPGVKR